MTFYAFNETYGSIGRFDKLPKHMKLGMRNIGPSHNNGPAPILLVTDNVDEMRLFLDRRRSAWTNASLDAIPLNTWTE